MNVLSCRAGNEPNTYVVMVDNVPAEVVSAVIARDLSGNKDTLVAVRAGDRQWNVWAVAQTASQTGLRLDGPEPPVEGDALSFEPNP
jgi:hypothetical protein